MLNHRQVMGDEQEAEASLLLQFFEQMDDVGLQADIQRGNRFITNDEVRFGDQSARDGRALPLPAGNIVGMTVGKLRLNFRLPHHRKHLFAQNSLAHLAGNSRTPLPIYTVRTIRMIISPLSGAQIPMIQRASVDLPTPDGPINPTISPQ